MVTQVHGCQGWGYGMVPWYSMGELPQRFTEEHLYCDPIFACLFHSPLTPSQGTA